MQNGLCLSLIRSLQSKVRVTLYRPAQSILGYLAAPPTCFRIRKDLSLASHAIYIIRQLCHFYVLGINKCQGRHSSSTTRLRCFTFLSNRIIFHLHARTFSVFLHIIFLKLIYYNFFVFLANLTKMTLRLRVRLNLVQS